MRVFPALPLRSYAPARAAGKMRRELAAVHEWSPPFEHRGH